MGVVITFGMSLMVSDNYHETGTIIVMLSKWIKQIHYLSQFKVEVYLGLVA